MPYFKMFGFLGVFFVFVFVFNTVLTNKSVISKLATHSLEITTMKTLSKKISEL